jgi:membrane-associated phospholipid phosphatase
VNHSSVSALIKANLPFLIPYLLFLCTGGVFIALYSKSDIHIWINEHTYGLADTFFRLITNLGDGLAVAVVALIFLLFRIRSGLLIAVSGIFAGVITQFLKHTFFSDLKRPVKFFEGVYQLHLVPGVSNYSGNSFPSGHSASAFALYLSIAMLTENKLLKFAMFLLASVVAFSRIYLSQHFLQDVCVGSLIGVLSVFAAFLILTRIKPFSSAGWMNKSFLGRKSLHS